MEFCRERDAISNLLNISRLGNQLMQAEKPWKLVKSTSKEDKVSELFKFLDFHQSTEVKIKLKFA